MAHEPAHGHLHHRSGPVAVQESTFHVQKVTLYFSTLVKLLILMVLTLVFAEVHFSNVNLGFTTIPGTMINNLVAMTIAVLKALLVLSIFMGLKFGTKLTKLWAVAGFVGFALLFLALGDYSTRVYEPTSRWSQDPGSSMRRSIPESRQEADFKKFERKGRF